MLRDMETPDFKALLNFLAYERICKKAEHQPPVHGLGLSGH